jgi:hypothetical protein
MKSIKDLHDKVSHVDESQGTAQNQMKLLVNSMRPFKKN